MVQQLFEVLETITGVVSELKELNGGLGTIREIIDIGGLSVKSLHEQVGLGLPSWDPPPPLGQLPPDYEAAARAQEDMGMSTLQERQAFDKVMQIYRQVADGEPRQPARVPATPPAAAPARPQEAPRAAA